MTKREAEDVLEREFGTREHLVASWCKEMAPKVRRAIAVLGGTYEPGWGLTVVPPEWKRGELPGRRAA